ncbi:MAG: YncE family protein [Aeromicrobium sp.]
MSRTEDVAFSPDGQTIAIANYGRDQVAFFRIELAGPRVRLTHAASMASTDLLEPHGLCFVDTERIIVASRAGAASVFKVPAELDGEEHRTDALAILGEGAPAQRTPGSVAVHRLGESAYDVLVCNNFAHEVARYRLDVNNLTSHSPERLLVRRWMDIPDGIAVSPDGGWIAISNHLANAVMLYRNDPSLHPDSDPDGIARGVAFPHGLTFNGDGTRLYVADAGSPYVHTYAPGPIGWAGMHHPQWSTRVMDEETFRRGRANPAEGGPKGMALHPSAPLMALTCETRPLWFVEIDKLTATAAIATASAQVALELDRMAEASGGRQAGREAAAALARLVEMDHEVSRRERQIQGLSAQVIEFEERRRRAAARAARAERRLAELRRSRSWRWTAPVRSAVDRWRRVAGR